MPTASTVSAAFRHLRHGAIPRKVANRFRRLRGGRPVLLREPGRGDRSHSSRRINALADVLGGEIRYLEVGVQYGRTLEDVEAEERWAVDPLPLFDLERLPPNVRVYAQTSDEFFASLDESRTFHIVFLDGLHHFEQTYRDLVHASGHLCEESAIVIDDVVPRDSFAAMRNQDAALAQRSAQGVEGHEWQGDVFKIMAVLRDHHSDISWKTLIESGNEQAILVLPPSSRPIHAIPDSVLESYRDLRYDEVFSSGVPEFFNPGTERELISWVKEELRRNPTGSS